MTHSIIETVSKSMFGLSEIAGSGSTVKPMGLSLKYGGETVDWLTDTLQSTMIRSTNEKTGNIFAVTIIFWRRDIIQ